MIRLLVVLTLALALEAGAQTFPAPGPGHLPWTAGGGGGGSWAAAFGTCTVGSNCHCDTAATQDPTGFCEDFDHNALWLQNPTDPGGYGNWVATTPACNLAHPNNRGCAGYWRQKYGNPDEGGGFPNGQPTSPTLGAPCNVPGFTMCEGYKEWRADDLWSANALGPWMDVTRPGEWDDENPTSLTMAVPGAPAGSEVFGNAAMAFRVGPGSTTGFQGAKSFGAVWNKLGIVAAVGYESNVTASGIYIGGQAAWKHLEFSGVNDGNNNDGLFGFRQTNSPTNAFPIQGFIFLSGCAGRAVTVRKGQVVCNDISVAFSAVTSDYSFPTDFALGQWHCQSAEYDFSNIAAVRVRQWLDGELLIDFDFDMTGTNYDGASADGVDGFAFNSYANLNNTGSPTTIPTRRYMDNLRMRPGAPRLCSEIGFPSSYNQAGL